MRFVRQIVPLMLILGSCAPKATLVEEADQPSKPTARQDQPEPADDPGALPNFRPDDGLLDPPGLTRMPTDGDMKSSVEEPNTTVIANPPEDKKPTSE